MNKCIYECQVVNGLIEKKDINNGNSTSDDDNVNIQIINNP